MKTVRGILFLGASVLAGCSAAHDVAVSSFRVIDAPANYVRRKIDPPATTTTTTTTTVASDSVTPGHHVAPSKRENQNRQVTTTQPGPAATPRVTQHTTVDKPKPSQTPAPRNVTTNPPAQFPTAKVVPGKPGYVFSPYDPSGGYVDVNGYPSGSKVKDPYSGKVFLVP